MFRLTFMPFAPGHSVNQYSSRFILPLSKIIFRSFPDISEENQLIIVTVCAKRNPILSEVEFYKYWILKHGPLLTQWLQIHNCVEYVQVDFVNDFWI